jgi:hypothetical protein
VPSSIVAHCALGDSIAIDGDLSDWPAAWFNTTVRHSTPGVEIAGLWSNSVVQNDRTLSGSFAASWDSSYLYFAVQITDDVRQTPSGTLWQDDAVEIYLDGANDRGPYMSDDNQLVFSADGRGQLYRDGPGMPIPSNIVFAVRDVPGGGASWNLEVGVPWGLLGGSAALGRLLGLDVELDDNDQGGGLDRSLLWKNMAPSACTCAGTCEPYCDTQPFYTIQLSGR